MEIKYLQVLVMPNGEILCDGKSIGWADNHEGNVTKYLFSKEEVAQQKE